MSVIPKAVPGPQTEAEAIVLAYLGASNGDARTALLHAVQDALTDLAEADRQTMRRDRLVSRGYVRAALHKASQN